MIKVNEAVVRKAIKEYGCLEELIVACEEMSELTKEISKALRKRFEGCEVDLKHICEETADVYIVLENIKKVFGITDEEVNRVISQKQHRLVNRMSRKRGAGYV